MAKVGGNEDGEAGPTSQNEKRDGQVSNGVAADEYIQHRRADPECQGRDDGLYNGVSVKLLVAVAGVGVVVLVKGNHQTNIARLHSARRAEHSASWLHRFETMEPAFAESGSIGTPKWSLPRKMPGPDPNVRLGALTLPGNSPRLT
jgi:hypothetical protein